MRISTAKPILFLLLLISSGVYAQEITRNFAQIITHGRVERSDDGITLIGSAASLVFAFEGDSLSLELESRDSWEHHNYVSIVLDGTYIKRLKIEKGPGRWYHIPVQATEKRLHSIAIYKATEAANGTVVFSNASAAMAAPGGSKKTKRIEFIGNSITCGMGNDTAEIPCGTGEWFDQHNAYWAYGPILSRKLGVDFLLSSVSGIGMYRNWNDEHDKEAIMPDVYGKLDLNRDSQKRYDFSFQPDIISICLGTNDLSDGDGKKSRLPFNEEQFTSNYIAFIKMLYSHNPNARIALLTSPMLSGEKHETLVRCLKKVMAAFTEDRIHLPIALFEFKPMKPNGCTYHPDIDDHKAMAAQLEPFFAKLLHEK